MGRSQPSKDELRGCVNSRVPGPPLEPGPGDTRSPGSGTEAQLQEGHSWASSSFRSVPMSLTSARPEDVEVGALGTGWERLSAGCDPRWPCLKTPLPCISEPEPGALSYRVEGRWPVRAAPSLQVPLSGTHPQGPGFP